MRVTTQYAIKIVTTPLNLPRPLFSWHPFQESNDNILCVLVNLFVVFLSVVPTIYFALANIILSLTTDSINLIVRCWNGWSPKAIQSPE